MLGGLDTRSHPQALLPMCDKPEQLLAGNGWPVTGDHVLVTGDHVLVTGGHVLVMGGHVPSCHY